MNDRRSYALHGAMYGTNFGDVLIHRLFVQRAAQKYGLVASLPLAGTRFLRDLAVPTATRARALRADFAILGPGGYFGERPARTSSWANRFVKYHGTFLIGSRLLGKPLGIFGLGVGPISDPRVRRLVRDALCRAHKVVVRDDESKAYCVSLGGVESAITVAPDIALLLATSGAPVKRPERNDAEPIRLGLHLPIPNPESDSAHALIADVNTLVTRSGTGVRVTFLADEYGWSPLPPGVRVNPRTDLRPYRGVDNLIRTIAEQDVLVTTKLHVGVVGFALGAKPVAVYNHVKVQRFFRQVGRDADCTELGTYEAGWLKQALQVVMGRGKDLERISILGGTTVRAHDSFLESMLDATT